MTPDTTPGGVLKGRVLTADLRRLVYNAKIYSVKTSSVKGHVLWVAGGDRLRIVATDDYFVLADELYLASFSPPVYRATEHKKLSELDSYLREIDDEYFDLADVETVDTDYIEALKEADSLVFEADQQKGLPMDAVAFHPDRLRKLSLIKPGGYPIDMKMFGTDEQEIVAFRCGPTVRGVVAPLNRKTLKGMYSGEELWP